MEALASTGLATLKLFKLLQKTELESTEDQSHEWPKHLLLAQFDRFELWAVNLGVFVTGHGSLDYRIRDSGILKESILGMMKGLNRSLDEALDYLHGSIEQEDEDSDTDSSSEMQSDMDLLIDSIRDPIDRLYKMAVWIRNPATRIPSTKARNLQQVDEETNVDLFKSFENFDYDHVSSLFLEYEKNKALQENLVSQPHDAVGDYEALVGDRVWEPIRKTLELNRMKISSGNESYLIRRIARANGLRRQQFAYWRRHKNKLREHATVAVEVPTHDLPTTNHIMQLENKNDKVKAPLTVTTATQLPLSHGTGKELEKENIMTLDVSEYAPSAWNPSKDIVSFPPPPKVSTTDGFFECPYCYTICPASILSEKAWSRDDWIQHEISAHQTVFQCPKHEEETFATLATYEEHTQKHHKEDAMPPSFAKSTATNFHRCCPVCSIVLGTTQKLQSHIALHLERFAMFTLPRCVDDNDERISGGWSASARGDSVSNTTSKTGSDSAAYHGTIDDIGGMRDKMILLRSAKPLEEFFMEEMEKIRFKLKTYTKIVRVWPTSNTTNTALFELGNICIEAGLIDEAIETLEHLKFLQISQLEHNDMELLQTKRGLARAYKVNDVLQEVGEELGHDADLDIEPNKRKALEIFVRTEAGMKHAQTIWGPNIWDVHPRLQNAVDKILQESYAQARQLPMNLAREDPKPSEESDIQEGIDLTGHSGQDPSQTDHDRRVPMDPPVITEFASERYFEKLRQIQADYQQANDAESHVTTTETPSGFILPLRDSSDLTDEKPQQSARGKKSFLSLRKKAAANASDDLNAVNAVAEQETTDNPDQLTEEEERERRHEKREAESEIGVLRETFKILLKESQAEVEQAPEGTELKLEAQALAQMLAQQTALYMSDVQELKNQFFEATERWDKGEKGNRMSRKIRSYDYRGMKEMINDIQRKREGLETSEERQTRQAREARRAQEDRFSLQISNIRFERHIHEGRKQRFIEKLEKVKEAIHADREQQNSSAAPGELEARDPSTKASSLTETSESELNFYQESIAEEEEKIRELIEKAKALEEELRLFHAEKEIQAPSGSESHKVKSRGGFAIITWQCCKCGMSGMIKETSPQSGTIYLGIFIKGLFFLV
ncbi:uncharacterized protein Triagg1_1688 [Trichoderma aggressivum f. europaeum]|uniref:Oxidoreductase acuF-like C2H2 type zinc-finger domain-containing protein n=1 Tax=Trichoderma aggressivum f. europaeum TaxID=173218 RepID=A0AAE1M2L6_9HYPO|nr:hypothetical protein Triagg1_1688 [Trichoderma aggressivum f. europaeum]